MSDIEVQSVISRAETSIPGRKFAISPEAMNWMVMSSSDGLQTPFGMLAGLSSLGNVKVVMYAGISELVSGFISMGLAGYAGEKSEVDSYWVLREEEEERVVQNRSAVATELVEIFQAYKIPKPTLDSLVIHLQESPELVDFLMRFKHGMEKPGNLRALRAGCTIGISYLLAGLIPLMPYLFVSQAHIGLYISIVVMAFAYFVFGYLKTCLVVGCHGWWNIRRGLYGGVEMCIMGAIAAGSSYGFIQLISHAQGGV